MPSAVIDLLPRDAELARRAAGGDGAAFVRLYDHYSHEVFATALAVTGSVEAAAEATQTAFLRILRWPPALGAPDGDVLELLYALALGGPHEHGMQARSRPISRSRAWWAWAGCAARPSRRPVRASTPTGACICGRRRPSAHRAACAACPGSGCACRRPPRRRPCCSIFLAGLAGTLLLSGGSTHPIDATPASATGEPVRQIEQRLRADLRRIEKRERADDAQLLRDTTLGPLLAP